VTLELIGNLEGAETGRAEYDLLYGLGPEGLATLRGCSQTQLKIHYPGSTRQVLLVRVAVLGAHLRDMVFSGGVLSFEHLAEWAPPLPPELRQEQDETGGRVSIIRYAPPAPLEATVDSGAVRLEWRFATATSAMADVALHRATVFVIDLLGTVGLDRLWDGFVRPLQNLVTLATGEPSALTSLEVWPAQKSVIAPPLPDGITRLPDVRVYYPLLLEPSRAERFIGPDKLFFQPSDLASDFSGHIRRWLAASEDIRAPMDLFFGSHYAPPRFLETRFLVYCQAAEVFHRIRYSNEAEDPATYGPKVRSVLDAIPEEHRRWVERALDHANYKTFGARIEELAKVAPTAVRAMLGDVPTFVRRVAKSRNYYTHWSRDGKDVLRGGALHWLTEELSLLMHAHLMRELGLDSATIDRRFAANRIVGHVRSQAASADGP